MSLLEPVLQIALFLVAGIAAIGLVKLLLVGVDRARRPREDASLQEHQSRSRAATGSRY